MVTNSKFRSNEECIALIKETVNYYKDVTRRSLSPLGNSCYYVSDDGNKCAVGRCLDLRKFNKNLEGNSIQDIYDEVVFKEKYQGYPLDLWLDLQELHDNNSHWDSKGLTDSGESVVKILIERYR
jgi:hypothetical protein